MEREKGMMGDMFGNMSFDSSDEEEGVVATADEVVVALAVVVADAGEEVEISEAVGVGSFGCENVQRNVEMNLEDVEACGGSLDVQPLRWGVQEDVTALTAQPPDLILASDCVYHDTLFEPLMQTLKWLFGIGDAVTEKVAVGPVLLLAHLRRWKKDGHFF